MNKEYLAVVEQAIAPLKQEIEALKAQLAALAAQGQVANAVEPPPNVKAALVIFRAIPEATVKALGVVQIGFDQAKIWFRMVRSNGSGSISVKKGKTDFRIRVRDQHGTLLKELNSPFNGLNAALKSLV